MLKRIIIMVTLIVVFSPIWSLAANEVKFKPGIYINLRTQDSIHYFPNDKDFGGQRWQMNERLKGYYQVKGNKLTLDLVSYQITELKFRRYTWSYAENGNLILIRLDNGQEYELQPVEYYD